MARNLKVKVSRKHSGEGLVRLRKMNIREKVMRFFLGPVNRLTILIPGDGVEKIIIDEKGVADARDQDVEKDAERSLRASGKNG